MALSLPTIPTRTDGHVLFATFSAPPLNLIGPEVVRDLVQLITAVDGDDEVRVVVFDSADPDFLFPHVDLTKVAEYTAEAGKGAGPDDASLGMLFRRVSELSAITVVKVTGRVRGAGSEFALACDLRYASRRRRSGTAGSTAPCPTPSWTPSSTAWRPASRRSPQGRCWPPRSASTP